MLKLMLMGGATIASIVLQASPVRFYVAETAVGDKDGSSWANAMTLPAAWAAAGAAEDGAEIWMKTGMYYIRSTGSLPLYPKIVVRGGFAGNEASADEVTDPLANPVIISGDGGGNWNYWSHIGNTAAGRIFTGTTYNPPNPDGTARGFYPYDNGTWSTSDLAYGFTNLTAVAADNAFHGVTFTAFCRRAVNITSAPDGETNNRITFTNCRFVGIHVNCYAEYPLYLYATDAVIDNCLYEGNRSGLRGDGRAAGQKAGSLIIRNCMFRDNYDQSECGAALSVWNNTALTVTNCVFRRGYCMATGVNAGPSSMITILSCAPALVVDCLFDDNQAGNVTRGGIYLSGPANALFSRCRFVNNRHICLGNYQNREHGAVFGLSEGANLVASDCYFGGNVMTNENANAKQGWGSCLAADQKTQSVLVNCTLEGNVAVNTQPGTRIATVCPALDAVNMALVNCLFLDNECFVGGVRSADVILSPNSGGGVCRMIINTVFHHSTAGDYISQQASPDKVTLQRGQIANSYLENFVLPTGKSDQGFCYDSYTSGDPLVSETAKTNGTVIARGVSWRSPYRKAGRPIWRGTDGWYYFRDTVYVDGATKPWRRIGVAQEGLSDEDALAVGVSLAAAPVPDAFGEERVPGKIAMGPLNAPTRGLTVIVK